jgi:hypothetical protein
MDRILEEVIKKKLSLLVDFILEKNPNASKERIYHKINELQFYKPRCIINAIQNQNMVLKAHKSKFSNYILSGPKDTKFDDLNKSRFVFDITIKTVIGVENNCGEIEPLNIALIEICHKYKLKYMLPLNLNIDDQDNNILIADEIQGLGLNYAESDEDVKNED